MSVAAGGTTASDVLWLTTVAAFAVVGSFIAARRPDHRIGWVLCSIGLLALAQNAAWRAAEPAGATPSAGRALAGWYATWGFEPLRRGAGARDVPRTLRDSVALPDLESEILHMLQRTLEPRSVSMVVLEHRRTGSVRTP